MGDDGESPEVVACVRLSGALCCVMIGFVVFSETAYTPKTTNFGSGVGIRLRTSPDTESLLSLDFGYGTTGPNIYLGVGEFF